jgi:hypothetical protein
MSEPLNSDRVLDFHFSIFSDVVSGAKCGALKPQIQAIVEQEACRVIFVFIYYDFSLITKT